MIKINEHEDKGEVVGDGIEWRMQKHEKISRSSKELHDFGRESGRAMGNRLAWSRWPGLRLPWPLPVAGTH